MDSDLLLAKSLQEQFDHEEIAKRNSKERQIKSKPTNSIIDPQWDLHDPTPDIYALFQMFNAKFFWGKLDCVEVKWSPRMYSCAGICTYKGLGGCVVSLSLPLLKLRPRKDLIETLLHEMIHAFLFVTDRNSEREEHGPKFHSHMYRINKEAGTNITVYHTFHDEVRHYKTHWWRCNGPCKSRPPYYGLVKRSMNRAPGPNDNWYAEHKYNCGGEFIKVKEPDGFKSRKSKKTLGDKENSEKQTSLDKYLSPPKHPSQPKVTANIFGMNSLDKKEVTKPTTEKHRKINNVHGFKGLTPTNLAKPIATKNTSKNNGRTGTGGGGGGLGLMSNRGGTLVERPRMIASSSTSASSNITLVQTTFTPYSGTGQVLDPNCQPSDINRANSRLLKLYPPANVKPSTPSPSIMENPKKKLKIDEHMATVSLLEENTSDSNVNSVNCPVCNKKLLQRQVNEHLDECINLNAIMERISETVVIEDDPVEDEQGENDSQYKNVNCPNCDKICKLDTVNQHLDECLHIL